MPKIITPNSNDLNNELITIFPDEVEHYEYWHITIFDRW